MIEPKRVSKLLPTLDTSLDEEILKQAAEYVCSDCGKADPDPILALLGRDLVFVCPSCSPAMQIPEGWRILSDNGTYYCGMSGIGPMFGASRWEAMTFETRMDVAMAMSHWAFATCKIEQPDGTLLDL